MKKGKWFLTYFEFDGMENHDPRYLVTVNLFASEEDVAVEEAIDVWKRKSVKTYKGYDKQTYPCEPKVIYEIDL